MSLINQMLQDLDARQAAHGVGSRLPNAVRPLPKPQASPLPIIVGVLVLLVLAGGLALFMWETRQQAVPPVPPAVPTLVIPLQVPSAMPPSLGLPAPEPDKIVSIQPKRAVQVPSTPATMQETGGSQRMAEKIKPPAEKLAGAKPDTVYAASGKPVLANRKTDDERSLAKVAETKTSAAAGLTLQGSGKSVRDSMPPTAATNPMIERTDAPGSSRERAETEYRKAIAAVNQGRIGEAVDGLHNALRQEPLHIASRQLLVKLLLEAKRTDEAAQVLQEGLQGQPAQIGWAMSLARLQVDRKDFTGAWQTLNYSLPAAGSNADYQGFMAHVLHRLGRHKEAAEHYQAATRLSPGDGRWWLGLGLALEEEGRVSEAREAFLRARQSGNLGTELSALVEQKLR
ncbi:MAG: tetratricopeptide repeat protein [Propionivibrio sp.]|uniref:tetratricopeptide repeat protein n=1 Tax=Propionivibrio sp. TaxID=2212460 RepID=UPI001A5A8697|nr:tetratricopeptide repeat protein [Propionivibrio sp.]MBL8412817.1 tetratricopeptide repeat protein [Propionivibrio sp.]